MPIRSIHSAASREVFLSYLLSAHRFIRVNVTCFFVFSRWSAKLWHWKIPSGSNTFCRCCAAFFSPPHASCYLTLAFTATLSLPPQHRLCCVNASSRECYRRKRNLKRNPQKWHPWTENSDRYVSLSATYSTCLLIKKNKIKKSPPKVLKGRCVS